jgi:hypothetical protein
MAHASIGNDSVIPGHDWNTEVARAGQVSSNTAAAESFGSPVDHVLIGSKGFIGDWRG